jgi:hypothetical protein
MDGMESSSAAIGDARATSSLYREPADENERSSDVSLSAACLRSGFPDLSQNSDFTAAAGFSAG